MTNTAINIVKALVATAAVALLVLFALVGITPVYANDAMAFDAETESLSVPSDFAVEADGIEEEVLPVYQGVDAATTAEVLPVYQGAEAAESTEVLPVYQYMNEMQEAA